jgi:hypothetical protein
MVDANSQKISILKMSRGVAVTLLLGELPWTSFN